MANDFDLPPLYDEVTKLKPDYLSDVWVSWFSTFLDDLKSYISQFGLIPPTLTTTQRNSIQSPQNGQTIYNITEDSAQYYQVSSGSWISYP
jgi:hypothetical protein